MKTLSVFELDSDSVCRRVIDSRQGLEFVRNVGEDSEPVCLLIDLEIVREELESQSHFVALFQFIETLRSYL